MTDDAFKLPSLLRLVRTEIERQDNNLELHDRHWLGAELLLLIEAATETRARMLNERPAGFTTAVRAMREVVAGLHEDAADHEHRDIMSEEPPDEERQRWWDEGYRCGVLSAIHDIEERIGQEPEGD